MPPFKNKSKPARKSEQDSAISLFKSGTRNLLIPLFAAENIYFNHPLHRTSVRVSTQTGPQWDAMVAEVKTLGLLPRLAEDSTLWRSAFPLMPRSGRQSPPHSV